MLWPGIWKHYHAPAGLGDVLRRYLEEARIDAMCFNTRTEHIDTADDTQTWRVSGSSAVVDGAGRQCGRQPVASNEPQAVVVCVPAPDATQIGGLQSWLRPDHCKILRDVEYDSRAVVAVCYNGQLRSEIESCFITPREDRDTTSGEYQSELDVDDSSPLLAMIIRQGSKREEKGGCMLVAHSKRVYTNRMVELAWDQAQMIHQVNVELSARSGMPIEELAAQITGSKMVEWKVSQLQRPMESVVDPVPQIASFVANSPHGLHLLCAGDYLTQSSFLGCAASALDAADRLIADVVRKHDS